MPSPISNVLFTSTTTTPFIQQSLTSTELRLYAQGGGAQELQNGDNITITFNSCIISTGTFTISAFQTSTYTSPRTLSGSQPSVTAKTITAGGPDNICEPTTPSAFILSGANFGGSAISAAWSITNLSPANGGLNGSLSNTSQTSSPSTITYTPPSNYQGNITLTLTTDAAGPCGAVSSTRILTVNSIPIITGSTPASRCGTGTLTLGATASAGTINWYSASTGGTFLGTGTSFTTTSLLTTTTYYVDATLNGCTTTARTAVIATVAGASDLWIGGTLAALTDWNTASNWSCGVPTATTDVTIPSGRTYYPVIGVANGICRTITDMGDGSISGTGSLTIAGNAGIAITNISGIAAISSPVIMPSSASITVAGTLTVSGVISGAGTGITKSGAGILIFSGANSFTGTTTISAGTLNIQNANGLGGTVGGTTVISGATLEMQGGIAVGNESLSLDGNGVGGASGGALYNVSGNNSWGGPISLNGHSRINSYGGTLTLSNTVNLGSYNLYIQGVSTNANTISGVISGTGFVNKVGGGVWALSGANTFSGGVLLYNGTLNINNPQALGTIAGVFTVGGVGNTVTIDNTSGSAITTLNYPMAWKDDFTFSGTNSLNLGTGNVTLEETRQVTVSANTLTVGGVISGLGLGLTKLGSGILTLNGTNSFTGPTIITAGELRLNPIVDSAINTPVKLNGGKLSTLAITSGRLITNGSTLELSAASSLDLGANPHSIKFAASNGVTWNGSTLTINGWTGSAGVSGTAGKIFFGSSIGTLSPAQLSKITFTGYSGIPILLPSGELVPTGPVLTITGIPIDFGSLCIGVASTPITYTITNTGATANGIAVSSNNPQFVVSNLSSTTISAGGTVTYMVTFTPSASGNQNTTITVTSITVGTNSPISSLTGTGLELPTIISQPQSELNCEGHIVSFNVVAIGTGLTYTWQRKYSSGSFANIPAELNVSYPSPGEIRLQNIGNSDAPDGTQYRVVITNSTNCTITSNPATLTVNEITGILPGNTQSTICQGSNFNYQVTTNYPSNVVSYQWKKYTSPGLWMNVSDGGAVSGATTSQLTFTNATPSESGQYKVTVVFHSSGADCNVTSDTRDRTLTVNASPDCTILGNSVVFAGSTNNLYTSTVTPSDNVTHAWSITGNGNIVGSLTESTVSISASLAGSFTLTDQTTRLGCTSSCTSVITVAAPCAITPVTVSVPNGTSTTYTAPAGMDSYSWSISGNGSITSATNLQTVTVLAGNNCSDYALSVALSVGGSTSNCSQTISVTDNQPPTFTKPDDLIFCVESLILATYNGATMDINPDRPDYFTLEPTNTLLDLIGLSDNCCAVGSLAISWRIDFSGGTPSSISGTGQPSGYGIPINLPGDGSTFLNMHHTITYWVTDCHGNVSATQTTNITIKPRPNIVKGN